MKFDDLARTEFFCHLFLHNEVIFASFCLLLSQIISSPIYAQIQLQQIRKDHATNTIMYSIYVNLEIMKFKTYKLYDFEVREDLRKDLALRLETCYSILLVIEIFKFYSYIKVH